MLASYTKKKRVIPALVALMYVISVFFTSAGTYVNAETVDPVSLTLKAVSTVNQNSSVKEGEKVTYELEYQINKPGKVTLQGDLASSEATWDAQAIKEKLAITEGLTFTDDLKNLTYEITASEPKTGTIQLVGLVGSGNGTLSPTFIASYNDAKVTVLDKSKGLSVLQVDNEKQQNNTENKDGNVKDSTTVDSNLIESQSVFEPIVPFAIGSYTLGGNVWKDNNKNGLKDDGTGSAFSGVEVELYQNGNLIKTTTTNSSGYYQFTNLSPGTYVIKIINPDRNSYFFTRDHIGTDPLIYSWYSPNDSSGGSEDHKWGEVTINLQSDNKTVQCGFGPKKATPILITKVDEQGNPVGGATFQIKKNNTLVETITTNSAGLAYSTPFKSGLYDVQETIAPIDYVLDPTIYTINVDQNNHEPEYVTMVNKRAVGAVEVTKKSPTGTPLAGATFQVKNSLGVVKDTITTDATGKATSTVFLTVGNYTLVETVAPSGYILDSTPVTFSIAAGALTPTKVTFTNVQDIGKLELTKKNSSETLLPNAVFQIKNSGGVVVDTITTNASGLATTTVDLTPGNYTAVEVTAPSGYVLDTTPRPFTIVDGASQPVKLTVYNVKDTGALLINKKSGEMPLYGAVFQIKDSGGTIVDTITTNINGQAGTTVDLAPGNYTAVEFTAPTGYILDTTPHPFTIVDGASQAVILDIDNVKDVGAITVHKTDGGMLSLAGAIFEIRDSNNQLIETITTNGAGIANSTLDLEPGNYSLIETQAPTGYVLNSNPRSFTIIEGATTSLSLDVTNVKDTGAVELTKTDGEDTMLQGAVYEVRNSMNVAVDTITTDASGKALSTVDLEPGNYTLVEITAPSGYVLDPTPISFTIVNGATEPVKVNGVNQKDVGTIEVTKVDKDNLNTLLPNAIFNIKDSNGTVVDSLMTDNLGVGETTVDLAPGNYTVVETKAPTGYILDPTPHPVTVTEGASQAVEITIENTKDVGAVKVTKVNEQGVPLAGIKFEIRDSLNNLIEEVTTDMNGMGQSTIDLEPGSYAVIETTTLPGYILDATPDFVTIVDGASAPVELRWVNFKDVGAIEVTKIAVEDNGIFLSGAIFEVRDSSNNLVDTITTNINGIATTTADLDPGTYTVKEVQAPTGYILDTTPYTVTVIDGASAPVKINLTNTLGIGKIKIIKTDGQGSPLEGAVFEIRDSGGTVMETLTTDSNGEATQTADLATATYQVAEVQTPAGYVINNYSQSVQITQGSSKVQTLEVTNVKDVGAIKLVKKDADSKLLEGAVFEIRDSNNQLIETITTGIDGVALTTVDLDPDVYTVTEIDAPTGYIPLSAPFEVTVVNGATEPVTLDVLNTLGIGKIKVIKTDGNGGLLENAVFEIRDMSGDNQETLTTDPNGEALQTADLPDGLYQVVETQSPSGYSLTTYNQMVQITQGSLQVLTLYATNPKDVGAITITKTGTENALLEGAVFEVKDHNEVTVDTITTNASGVATTTVDLIPGEYTVKEITAPIGYLLNETTFDVTIVEGATAPVALTINNIQGIGKIKVIKTDGNGTPLANAVFEIKNDLGQTQEILTTDGTGEAVQTEELESGLYTVVETSPPSGYSLANFSQSILLTEGSSLVQTYEVTNPKDVGAIQVNKKNELGQPLADAIFEVRSLDGQTVYETLTTGADGIALTTVDLEPGTYHLVEVDAPSGYILDATPMTVTIVDGATMAVPVNVHNAKDVGVIKINKTNESQEPLALAVFEVRDSSDTLIETITTDHNGVASTTIDLQPGNYTVKEIIAPTGYSLDPVTHPVDITDGARLPVVLNLTNLKDIGEIEVLKQGPAPLNTPLAGAVFEVRNSNNMVVDTLVTDAFGQGSSDVDLEPGTYTLVETVAPEGYVLDGTPIPFTIVAGATEPVQKVVENHLQMGIVSVHKFDPEESRLEHAIFVIKDEDGNTVDTLDTDINGDATSHVNLPPGLYTLVEIDAPTGYIIDETPHPFMIQPHTETPVDVTLENMLDIGALEILKTDGEGKLLANAVFEIRDENGTLVETITTGADARGITTNSLAPGSYTATEITAPNGYVLDPVVHPFAIVEGARTPIFYSPVNEKDIGIIELTKEDSEGNPLEGAVFEIKDAEGTVIETITSDVEGRAVTTLDLTPGMYTVEEVVAPIGYTANLEPVSVEIKEGSSVSEKITLVNSNEISTISLLKVSETGQPLEGAVFEIRDSNNTVVETLTTDQDGKATPSHALEAGTYKVVETKAPDHYVLDTEEIVFPVTRTGNAIFEKSVVNIEEFGSLEVSKINNQNKPLEGAEFNVENSQGQIVATAVTDKNGKAVTTTNLEPGAYTLKETKAPNGYILNSKPIEFTIAEGTTDPTQMEVLNLAGTSLPKTGGYTSTLFAGMLISLGAWFTYLYLRKLKKQSDKKISIQ